MDTQYQKVIWTEGMFLRPHHFQQQERYLEDLSCQHLKSTVVHASGFAEYELIAEKSSMESEVILKSARGIMPSGAAFNLTQGDVQALRLPIGELHQVLYLALPIYQEGAEDIVFADEPATNARYVVDEIELADTSEISLGTSTVQVGRPRFRLCLADDLPNGYEFLRVARILEVTKEGQIIEDKHYIPEILHYQTSPKLVSWIKEILDLLLKRVDDLSLRLKQIGRSSLVDITDLMTLQTLNRYCGVFHYLRQLKQLHPERVYREFASLAYELATFTQIHRTRDITQFPEYKHQNLQQSFEPLVRMISQDLSFVMKEPATEIKLVSREGGLKLGKVEDMQLFKQAQFVLSVGSSLPLDTLALRFPSQSKMGAFEKIRDLVHLQLPGIKLTQLSSAPPQLPYDETKIYFTLDKKGELWDTFEKSGQIALHLAGDFPDLDLRFWALQEL